MVTLGATSNPNLLMKGSCGDQNPLQSLLQKTLLLKKVLFFKMYSAQLEISCIVLQFMTHNLLYNYYKIMDIHF